MEPITIQFTEGQSIPFSVTVSNDESGSPLANLAGYSVDFLVYHAGCGASRDNPLFTVSGPSVGYAGTTASWLVNTQLSANMKAGNAYPFEVRVTKNGFGISAVLHAGILVPASIIPSCETCE